MQKYSIDVMFKQGPECQKIFKSSTSGVTITDMDDYFNTSSHAVDQTLDLMLWDCLPLQYVFSCYGPDIGSDVVGLPATSIHLLMLWTRRWI